MATYAIGDVQGCFSALMRLLDKIQFTPASDTLWLTGDLVNRGKESLETLRFLSQLGDKHRIVLGNHDLHLLALAHHAHRGFAEDTLAPILMAPDREELLSWLQKKPLIQHDTHLQFTMVHAGLAASWNLETAIRLSKEVEAVLQGENAALFFQNMYGNTPDQWHEELTGWDRLRCITNFFTRARFCFLDGRLELRFKGALDSHPENLIPWYQVPKRVNADLQILFGHWAALGGVTHTPNTYALDTGCVWGFNLTALRLEDKQVFQVACDKI